MELNTIDSVRDGICIDKNGIEIPCSPERYNWLMQHSWFIFQNRQEQKKQQPFDMKIHLFVLWEIEPNYYKRVYGATVIGGGTVTATSTEESDNKKESEKRKWTVHFYEAWREGPCKVLTITTMVYKKRTLKEVLPYLGIVVHNSFFYSPQFCAIVNKQIVVKPHFNLPYFRCPISRHEYEERVLLATFQLLFDMKRHHIDAFESVVQNGVKVRFPSLGPLFLIFYRYCFNQEDSKLPSAHLFPKNDFLDESNLKFLDKILNEEEHQADLSKVIATINKFLSAWRIQGACRKDKIQEETVACAQCKLAKQVYPYLSIHPVTVVMSLEKAYKHWFDFTPGPEKMEHFNRKNAKEYTRSVDKIVQGLCKSVECMALDETIAPKYISNFKELIHYFWFRYNRFALTESDHLYNDNHKLFKDLSKEVQEKLCQVKVTFTYRCKEQPQSPIL